MKVCHPTPRLTRFRPYSGKLLPHARPALDWRLVDSAPADGGRVLRHAVRVIALSDVLSREVALAERLIGGWRSRVALGLAAEGDAPAEVTAALAVVERRASRLDHEQRSLLRLRDAFRVAVGRPPSSVGTLARLSARSPSRRAARAPRRARRAASVRVAKPADAPAPASPDPPSPPSEPDAQTPRLLPWRISGGRRRARGVRS